MSFIEWVTLVFQQHESIQYIIVFLAAAFGGEIAMISMSFLLAQGFFSFYPFVTISYIGTYSSDIMWFWLGKSKMVSKLFTHRHTSKTIHVIVEAMHKMSKGSDFMALFLANFMPASRVILIMYVSRKNLEFVKFLYYEAVALFWWTVAVVAIGYTAGIGYTYLSNVLNSIYSGVGFVLVFLFIIILVQVWFKHKVEEKSEEILAEK